MNSSEAEASDKTPDERLESGVAWHSAETSCRHAVATADGEVMGSEAS